MMYELLPVDELIKCHKKLNQCFCVEDHPLDSKIHGITGRNAICGIPHVKAVQDGWSRGNLVINTKRGIAAINNKGKIFTSIAYSIGYRQDIHKNQMEWIDHDGLYGKPGKVIMISALHRNVEPLHIGLTDSPRATTQTVLASSKRRKKNNLDVLNRIISPMPKTTRTNRSQRRKAAKNSTSSRKRKVTATVKNSKTVTLSADKWNAIAQCLSLIGKELTGQKKARLSNPLFSSDDVVATINDLVRASVIEVLNDYGVIELSDDDLEEEGLLDEDSEDDEDDDLEASDEDSDDNGYDDLEDDDDSDEEDDDLEASDDEDEDDDEEDDDLEAIVDDDEDDDEMPTKKKGKSRKGKKGMKSKTSKSSTTRKRKRRSEKEATLSEDSMAKAFAKVLKGTTLLEGQKQKVDLSEEAVIASFVDD